MASEISINEYETTDDLEKTLMLAAADADSRNTEVEVPKDSPTSDFSTEAKKETEPLKPDKSLKRKHERNEDESNHEASGSKKHSAGLAKVVANHYNSIEEKGLAERAKSRIVYLRNFHNWIKSMLINDYLSKIKNNKKHNAPISVLDMACGKGGDLLKWRKGNIKHLICTDIADVSLEQCKQRYNEMKNKKQYDRNSGSLFSVEFIAGDSTKMRLREKFSDPTIKLDLVSCQFAFHYSFESLPQAECMLRNAGECLAPGGYFIGTIPDAYDLIARARKNEKSSFGNDVYKVVFASDITKPEFFGTKYHFYLDGVVNCPEFLVYFPVLVKLAKKYGLKLVHKEKFYDYYERMKLEGRQLLSTMSSLESYPPGGETALVGTMEDDYTHADQFFKSQDTNNVKLGTLSKSEWEASSLYMVFAFEKVKHTWNADGTPLYDI